MSSKTASTAEPDVAALLQDAVRDLERYAAELERSNRDLEQFAYAASHDLQTPLRKVRSFSLLLKEELAPDIAAMDPERRKRLETYFRFIVDGADRSQELINGLLSFSRIGRRVEKEWMPLDDALDDAVFILEEHIKKKSVRLERHPLPVVFATPSLMARVFQNLLGNAIKFRSDERKPRIEVGVDDLGQEWRVYVKDNGIGIDARHRERVFVIFQRIGAKKRGTGLGLALCKKIIESHGGKIWYESELGAGTVFYFTMPKEGTENAVVDAA